MARGLVRWVQREEVAPLGRLFGLVPAQRSYEGAKVTRCTVGWYAPATGPNAENQGSLTNLRNRQRFTLNPASIPLWYRREVPAGASSLANDSVVVSVYGESA